MDGFYIINKEKGMTSFQVCHRLEKAFHLNKCGHTGTLDPNTTGVLVVGVNSATKLMKLLNEHDKKYITTITFGYETSTLDNEGEVLKEKRLDFLDNEIIDEKIAILAKKTTQIPPIYSAIKVNGKKMYEYARKNQVVEIKPRDITIYSAKRIDDVIVENGVYSVKVYLETSKGFYVRSFARDLGIELDNYGTMTSLERIESGDFNISNSHTLTEIIDNQIGPISIDEVFNKLPVLEVNSFLGNLVKNGTVLDERQLIINEPFKVVCNGQLLAIYEPFALNKYKPIWLGKR